MQSMKHKVIKDKKRFLRFPPDYPHPAILNMEWTVEFPEQNEGEESKHLLIRKINVNSYHGKILAEWIWSKHIDKQWNATFK